MHGALIQMSVVRLVSMDDDEHGKSSGCWNPQKASKCCQNLVSLHFGTLWIWSLTDCGNHGLNSCMPAVVKTRSIKSHHYSHDELTRHQGNHVPWNNLSGGVDLIIDIAHCHNSLIRCQTTIMATVYSTVAQQTWNKCLVRYRDASHFQWRVISIVMAIAVGSWLIVSDLIVKFVVISPRGLLDRIPTIRTFVNWGAWCFDLNRDQIYWADDLYIKQTWALLKYINWTNRIDN